MIQLGIARLQPAEVRSTSACSYTNQAIAHLLSAAAGTGGDGSSLAAVEVAARWWGAGLSSASVTPSTPALKGVTAGILDGIGRNLCRRGESVHAISVRNGQIVLMPAGSWTISGGAVQEEWKYRVVLNGPSSSRTVTLDSDSVLHCRYAASADAPWRGRSPLTLAIDTFRAAALLEGAAAAEFGFTAKQMIAPRRGAGDFSPIDSLTPEMIQKIVTAFAEHVGAPTVVLGADVVPSRLGPSPPDSFADLRDRFQDSILAACGIPPSLIAPRATGTGQREGFRQTLHILLKPLGALVVEELKAKLDPDAEISFSDLRAGDIVGTSRALGSLVKAGLTPQAAAAIVGLDDDEVNA